MFKFIYGLLLVLICFQGNAQIETRNYIVDPKFVPREHNVDMIHLKLDVSFEPEKRLVKGKVTHKFITLQKDVDTLFLDGIDMTFKDVKLDGVETEFYNSSKGITIKFNKPLIWNSEHEVSLSYEAQPREGLYFIGWNDERNISRKQIWSQGQGIDNRNWIPMYDEMNDKVISEMIVTMPDPYKVLSNGTQLKSKSKGGLTTWHYKMTHPHAPYLIMLGIGVYEIKETKSKSGVPMHLYYYPEWKDRVEATYRYSEDMMDYFETTIGVKYPWESYAQIPVQDFMYGAMENTTATIYGDFYHCDDRAYLDKNYVSVNAHELAHQWFGDLITARNSTHHWLQESFATHYNMLYERKAFGTDHFDWKRYNGNKGSLNASLSDYLPVAHSEAGSTRHYPKGAFVLNMLRYVVGDEEFNKSVKYYLEQHAYQNVDSKDLLVAFHETLGLSLDWFWEQWVHHGGEPHYKVDFQEVIKNGQRHGQFNVNQIHQLNDVVGLFKMPIEFEIWLSNGKKISRRVMIQSQHQIVDLVIDDSSEIDYVLFDPNNQILKKVTFEKSITMLKKQGEKSTYLLDRHAAVLAMKTLPLEETRNFLVDRAGKETYQGILKEIYTQLSSDMSDAMTINVFKTGLGNEDALVRFAAAEAMHGVPAELKEDLELLLKDKSYNNIDIALQTLLRAFPTEQEKYFSMTKDIEGTIGRNVRITWLEQKAALTSDQKAFEQLVDYVSNSYEFKTRVAAAQALQRLDYFDDKLMMNLVEAMPSGNHRMGNPCGKVLQYFFRQHKYQEHIIDYLATLELDKWEHGKIYRYMK